MIKWANLLTTVKQRCYEDSLKELAAIQDYDDLQDALQVVPFKSLNQDLPASLPLLEKLYSKFKTLTNDKEEGRLIIRHVFKADLLLKNFIRVEVENVVVGGTERELQCMDMIGHIVQITWIMDCCIVEELIRNSSRLKSALEHYQSSKSLLSNNSFVVDDIKSNIESYLTNYHSFVHRVEALTKASTRKYSEGKGYTVVYREEHVSSRRSSTSRYSDGDAHNPLRSKSLVQDVTTHRGSVEQVRKRRIFNQAVLNVIEPYKEDIEQGPRLLQTLRRLVENDTKFLDVISELSPHITSPCFADIKLHKTLGHFVNSYDKLLSEVTSQNESDEKSVNSDDEILKKKTKGLVDNGLKIDVTTSSPFRRRYDAKRRPILREQREQREQREPLRTHSCREPGTGKAEKKLRYGGTVQLLEVEHASTRITGHQERHGSETEVQESRLQEKLTMRDKQLTETQTLVKNLKKREEQLLEKLTMQAKNHLMRSEKFENISDKLPRTEQLIKQYDDLYSQVRLEAMDDLDNIKSLSCMEKSDEIKSQISFALMTVSFLLTVQELENRRKNIHSLLGVDQNKLENGHYASLENEITLQLRRSAAEIDLKYVVDEVVEGLYSTMFDFPELRSCQELRHFAEACVRFSWTMSTHVPPLVISYDAANFMSSMHSKYHNSDKDCNTIRYHIWPALLDSQTNAVLFKGIVAT